MAVHQMNRDGFPRYQLFDDAPCYVAWQPAHVQATMSPSIHYLAEVLKESPMFRPKNFMSVAVQ
ncbi:MAG: hypothetical protein EON54_25660 [Alcaligenaceae bacterium]|nr:MAG: hypothetical protein EON54_25660 [Alcaligenaceae bacterium]